MPIKKGFTLQSFLLASALAIAAFCYIPTVILYYIDTNEIYDEDVVVMKKVTVGLSRRALSFALSAQDREIMTELLNEIVSNPLVYSAKLTDSEGTYLLERINPEYEGFSEITIQRTMIDIYSTTVTGNLQLDEDVITSDFSESDVEPVTEKRLEGKLELETTRYQIDINRTNRLKKSLMYSSLIFAVVIAVLLFWVRRFSFLIKAWLNITQEVSDGNLTVQLPTDYAIKEINIVAQLLNTLVTDVDRIGKERDVSYQEAVEGLRRVEEAQLFKTQFLQMAAHQIRTPITSILGYLELTQDALPANIDSKIKHYLDRSGSCAEELEQQLVTILNLSALEQGALAVTPTWFLMNKPFISMTRIFESKCTERGLKFACSTGFGGDVQCFADKNIINQILSNIIDNAIKYTSKGFVRVVYQQIDQNLIVTIEDSGIGISEEGIKIIMEAPRQLDQGVTRSQEGWGFGMPSVHKYLALIKGKISFESEIDRGTTVNITIPMQFMEATGKLVPEKNRTLPAPLFEKEFLPEVQRTIEQRVIKVLIVDDNKDSRDIIRGLLAMNSIKPFVVDVDYREGGREAITACRETAYDLLIIDYHMPGMNGIEFAEDIKSNDSLSKDAYMVGCTADTQRSEQVHQQFTALMQQVFIKPITASELRSILREISLVEVNS